MACQILVLALTVYAFTLIPTIRPMSTMSTIPRKYTIADLDNLQIFAKIFEVQNMSVYHMDNTSNTLVTATQSIIEQLSDGSTDDITDWPRQTQNNSTIERYEIEFISQNYTSNVMIIVFYKTPKNCTVPAFVEGILLDNDKEVHSAKTVLCTKLIFVATKKFNKLVMRFKTMDDGNLTTSDEDSFQITEISILTQGGLPIVTPPSFAPDTLLIPTTSLNLVRPFPVENGNISSLLSPTPSNSFIHFKNKKVNKLEMSFEKNNSTTTQFYDVAAICLGLALWMTPNYPKRKEFSQSMLLIIDYDSNKTQRYRFFINNVRTQVRCFKRQQIHRWANVRKVSVNFFTRRQQYKLDSFLNFINLWYYPSPLPLLPTPYTEYSMLTSPSLSDTLHSNISIVLPPNYIGPPNYIHPPNYVGLKISYKFYIIFYSIVIFVVILCFTSFWTIWLRKIAHRPTHRQTYCK